MTADHPSHEHPRLGTGVWIRRGVTVLVGLRTWKHAPHTWSPPGGKVELYEDPMECARREVLEETGLKVANIKFLAYTNDLYPHVHQHYLTLHFVADWDGGEARRTEPDKFAEWGWYPWNELPDPLLLSARNFVQTGYNPFTL